MANPKVNESELERSIDRAYRGIERSQGGRADPLDQKEHETDVVAGRDRDPTKWRAVMERFGFRWYEPQELDIAFGKQTIIATEVSQSVYWHRNHTDGEWRCIKRRMAFRLQELAANFGSPETFAIWIEDQDLKRRAAKAGVVLSRKV